MGEYSNEPLNLKEISKLTLDMLLDELRTNEIAFAEFARYLRMINRKREEVTYTMLISKVESLIKQYNIGATGLGL